MAWQSLKAIAGYAVAVLIVICFLKSSDPAGFIGASLAAAIGMFFLLIYPRDILVEDGVVSFVNENGISRSNVEISDIIATEVISDRYNTLTFTTRFGHTYKIHPKDAAALNNLLKSIV